MEHEAYMQEAIRLAKLAMDLGETPVGCVIVKDGAIIGRGMNRRETDHSAIAHAEILAIEEACQSLGAWRLSGCTMYVTLEPCPMCAGAIINARIQRLYYGAKDEKAGSCGSVINLFEERYNHHPQIVGGLLKEPCGQLLTDFFVNLRKKE